MNCDIHVLRHRLALLANSAERLITAGTVMRDYRERAGAVADDILAARLLLENRSKADAADA